jgi:hypothetical protein
LPHHVAILFDLSNHVSVVHRISVDLLHQRGRPIGKREPV